MKAKLSVFLISALFSTALFSQWKMVGNADYNWGPFQIYTLSLYTETGTYQDHQRPLMLSFKYDKPVEGKNFAISLIKEIQALSGKENTDQWLAELQKIFPDFSPNDVLSYIALPDKGYFILNDTVLDYEFDENFTQAFMSSFLSPKGSYSKILPQLLGEKDTPHSKEKRLLSTPDVEKINEDEVKPQFPPKLETEQKIQEQT